MKSPKLDVRNIHAPFLSLPPDFCVYASKKVQKRGALRRELENSSSSNSSSSSSKKKKPTHPASAGLLKLLAMQVGTAVQLKSRVIGDTIMIGDTSRNPCKCSGGKRRPESHQGVVSEGTKRCLS